MRQPRASHVGITFNNTIFLKARLNDEIVRLERQLNDLRSGDQASNFGLVQSYKEMIYSRKEMLSDLPH